MFKASVEILKGEFILQNTPFNGDFQAVIMGDQISVTFDLECDMYVFIRLTK